MVDRLPPRERQITTIIIARGEASAEEIRAALPDPISDPAVRSMLTRLIAKNVLVRRKQGRKFLYRSATSDPGTREAALRRLSRDYFEGSLARVAAIATALLVSDGVR